MSLKKIFWRDQWEAENLLCQQKYSSLIGYSQFLFVYAQRRLLSDSRKLQILSSRYFLLQKTFCFYAKEKKPQINYGFVFVSDRKRCSGSRIGNEWMRIWRWVFLKAILKVGVICIVVVVLGSWSSWSRKNLGSMVIIFAKFCLESRILETTSTNQHVISLVSKSRNHLFFSFS